MNKKVIIIRVALLLACYSNLFFVSKSFSQDFHLSQYDAFAQYLNPAMTGMFNGDVRVNVQIRSQWASVIPNPYKFGGMGCDMSLAKLIGKPKLKDFKVGAYLLNERAGASQYNVFDFALSGAYDWAIKQKDHHVSFGLQLGTINTSVNTSALYFNNQYNDGGFNTTIPSGESFNNTNTLMPELNTGVMYYYSKVQSRLNPFAGFSVFHITEPKETFLKENSNLPRRYSFNGGTKININRQHQINLSAIYMWQVNVTEFQGNIMGMSYLKGRSDVCLLYGFGHRIAGNIDSEIIRFGLQYRNYTCQVSYDINDSQLQQFSSGRGGFEVSLVYIHSKRITVPPLVCPRI